MTWLWGNVFRQQVQEEAYPIIQGSRSHIERPHFSWQRYTTTHRSSMANPNAAAAVIGVLNKVIKYAVGVGMGASILQTSLYTGELVQGGSSSSGVKVLDIHSGLVR